MTAASAAPEGRTDVRNQAMQRKHRAGEALDVEQNLHDDQAEAAAMGPGVYRIRGFTDDVDYFVRSTEAWIWSIGRRRLDDAIFAATDARFYQDPDYECLFLR